MIDSALYTSMHGLRNRNVGLIVTPKYFQPQTTADQANHANWNEFSTLMKPIRTITYPPTSTEFLITPKNQTWSNKDVACFVGNPRRDINILDDFQTDEGIFFFKLNFDVARRLLDMEDKAINVGLGFNPTDFSVGGHSLRRVHSHVYVADNSTVNEQRKEVKWNELSRYDKFQFLEPFAGIYYDLFADQLTQGMFQNFSPQDVTNVQNGYLSVNLESTKNLAQIFPEVQKLVHMMGEEYKKIEYIFTDKKLDVETNRYLPVSESERFSRLDGYLQNAPGWLSESSILLLKDLCKKIKTARTRESSTTVTSSDTLWMTKGYAGGINFHFNKDNDTVRFDFIPRVVSTSNMSKVLYGAEHPTILQRGPQPASPKDQELMQDYLSNVITFLDTSFVS